MDVYKKEFNMDNNDDIFEWFRNKDFLDRLQVEGKFLVGDPPHFFRFKNMRSYFFRFKNMPSYRKNIIFSTFYSLASKS